MAKTKAWYMVCVLKLIETCLGQDPGVWGTTKDLAIFTHVAQLEGRPRPQLQVWRPESFLQNK